MEYDRKDMKNQVTLLKHWWCSGMTIEKGCKHIGLRVKSLIVSNCYNFQEIMNENCIITEVF